MTNQTEADEPKTPAEAGGQVKRVVIWTCGLVAFFAVWMPACWIADAIGLGANAWRMWFGLFAGAAAVKFSMFVEETLNR